MGCRHSSSVSRELLLQGYEIAAKSVEDLTQVKILLLNVLWEELSWPNKVEVSVKAKEEGE